MASNYNVNLAMFYPIVEAQFPPQYLGREGTCLSRAQPIERFLSMEMKYTGDGELALLPVNIPLFACVSQPP